MLSWLKTLFSKNTKYEEEDTYLIGVNLSKWEYLGYTEIKFHNEEKIITSKAIIYCFVSKKTNKRKIVLKAFNDNFEFHPWYLKYGLIWQSGEWEIYKIVETLPSDYLKKYMLETYSVIWSKDESWWISNDKSKYEAAKIKQGNKQPITEIKDNIVIVKFNKDKEE